MDEERGCMKTKTIRVMTTIEEYSCEYCNKASIDSLEISRCEKKHQASNCKALGHIVNTHTFFTELDSIEFQFSCSCGENKTRHVIDPKYNNDAQSLAPKLFEVVDEYMKKKGY